VGGSPFIERIKNAMGAMAKGRSVQPTKGAFELREAQSAYNAIFGPQNSPNRPSFSIFLIAGGWRGPLYIKIITENTSTSSIKIEVFSRSKREFLLI
jgi:hypothetical protein